jgi:hypothetical protein
VCAYSLRIITTTVDLCLLNVLICLWQGRRMEVLELSGSLHPQHPTQTTPLPAALPSSRRADGMCSIRQVLARHTAQLIYSSGCWLPVL